MIVYSPRGKIFIAVLIRGHNANCSRVSREDATIREDTAFENQSLCQGVDWTIEPVPDELVTINRTRGDSSSILVDQSWTGRWSTIKKEREIGSSVANWISREMTNRSGRCWSSCSLSSVRLSSLEEECYRLGGLNCPNDSLCRSVRLFSCISVYNLETIERGNWQVRRHLEFYEFY